MNRILVIGAQGQLGRDLCPRLSGEVIAAGRDRADLNQPSLLESTIDAVRPNIVINCAAYNFVDKAESEPEAAFAVNAFAVRNLAVICARTDCTLVHFSTDYVYGLDTSCSEPWRETDAPGPVSVYGASKLAGEYFVRSYCPKHFVIRTCGLYGVWGSGGKGGNFVETMLRVASQGKPLRVVADQRCTPTYTADLAMATVALISTEKPGLYHITNSGSMTWHEFAATIFEMEGIDADLTPISSAAFGAAARRPAFSVLNTELYHSLALPPIRPWKEAIQAYLTERRSRHQS
jgi:dTDP-4-dehydrorhamnose reductase